MTRSARNGRAYGQRPPELGSAPSKGIGASSEGSADSVCAYGRCQAPPTAACASPPAADRGAASEYGHCPESLAAAPATAKGASSNGATSANGQCPASLAPAAETAKGASSAAANGGIMSSVRSNPIQGRTRHPLAQPCRMRCLLVCRLRVLDVHLRRCRRGPQDQS